MFSSSIPLMDENHVASPRRTRRKWGEMEKEEEKEKKAFNGKINPFSFFKIYSNSIFFLLPFCSLRNHLRVHYIAVTH